MLVVAVLTSSGQALEIAANGKAKVVIVQPADASPAEETAARELTGYLQQITGATFPITNAISANPRIHSLIVGPGEAAAKLFPEIDFTQFGAEEFVLRSKNGNVLLAGGRPRGTLYAVEHFLQEQCGVRWWTPWATNVPHHATLRVPNLDVREQPVFEYREPFWSAAFDPLWKAHNGANGEHNVINILAISGRGIGPHKIVIIKRGADDYLALVIGFLAVILGTLNVVGGFVVTDRMLEMFSKKKK